MRDYNRKKGKYILPPSVYHQTLWIIRDYDRMREELHDIATLSPAPPDGMPSGTNITDEVYKKVKKREVLYDKVLAIEKMLDYVPEEYRKAVWENIQSNKPFPNFADRTTYSRHKSKYIYKVAEKLKII